MLLFLTPILPQGKVVCLFVCFKRLEDNIVLGGGGGEGGGGGKMHIFHSLYCVRESFDQGCRESRFGI